MLAIGNGLFGIHLEYASQNLIGGVLNPEGNLISGHQNEAGVRIEGGRSNIVQGNRIGTNVTGTSAIANLDGVELVDSYDNWIGPSPGLESLDRGNLISGNRGTGLLLEGITHGNRVMGNRIGVQKDGASALRNDEDGIRIDLDAFDNIIGGITSAEGNTIAYNGGSGIVVADDGGGNAMRGNSIHDNAVLGIDLGGDGITLNDPMDSDNGPNDLLNYPTLVAANFRTAEVGGILSARPFTQYTIDFYRMQKAGTFGYGQGDWYAGSTTVTTDRRGDAIFIAKPEMSMPGWITATATDPEGNTSEFSACVRVSDDSDDDGVGDDIEDQGPHDGDGNQDGVPDSRQRDVATMPTFVTGTYTTLVAEAGAAFQDVQAGPAPVTPPPGWKFDLGYFRFNVILPAAAARRDHGHDHLLVGREPQ